MADVSRRWLFISQLQIKAQLEFIPCMLHSAFTVILRSQDCSINLSVVALDGNTRGYSQEWVLWMVSMCVSYKLFLSGSWRWGGASVHSFPPAKSLAASLQENS